MHTRGVQPKHLTEKDKTGTPALSYDREILNQTIEQFNSNLHNDRLDMED